MSDITEHLMIQREITRGEGPCWFVEDRSKEGRRMIHEYPHESAFFGRGAAAKARKAMREMLEIEKEKVR